MTKSISSVWMAAFVLLVGGLPACSDMPRPVVLHDPLTPAEHVTLGMTYEEQGLQEMAALEYQAALQQRLEFVPALISLGNLSVEKGALKEAEGYYRRALVTAPDHPGANNNLAVVYLMQGRRIDEAEQLARRALEQAGPPLRAYVLDTMARVYMLKGEYVDAREALEEAASIAPPDDKLLLEQLKQLRQELAGGKGQRL
jgi:tetratricopeptide (TPR) repeat protein